MCNESFIQGCELINTPPSPSQQGDRNGTDDRTNESNFDIAQNEVMKQTDLNHDLFDLVSFRMKMGLMVMVEMAVLQVGQKIMEILQARHF